LFDIFYSTNLKKFRNSKKFRFLSLFCHTLFDILQVMKVKETNPRRVKKNKNLEICQYVVTVGMI
jgi:hypothetical protein